MHLRLVFVFLRWFGFLWRLSTGLMLWCRHWTQSFIAMGVCPFCFQQTYFLSIGLRRSHFEMACTHDASSRYSNYNLIRYCHLPSPVFQIEMFLLDWPLRSLQQVQCSRMPWFVSSPSVMWWKWIALIMLTFLYI